MEVVCARVYLLGKQGRYTELIPIAQRAVEAYPYRTNFNLWLGTCLMRMGRAAEAIPQLEQDMRLNPRSPWIYSRYELMGYALTFLGRYEEAISWLSTIARSSSQHGRVASRPDTCLDSGGAGAFGSNRGGAGQCVQSMPPLAAAHGPGLPSRQNHEPRYCRTGLSYARGVAACRHSRSRGRGLRLWHNFTRCSAQ